MDNAATIAGLLSLPNEILLDIFSSLRSPALLPLTSVCHRFHDVILRILHHRLSLAASLNGRSIILECYAPSRKLYESYMHGLHLGTHGLDEIQSSPDGINFAPGEHLKGFNDLYTRFLPYRRQLEKRVQWKHPAGDIPGSRTYRSATDTNAIPTMMAAGSFSSPLLDDAEEDDTPVEEKQQQTGPSASPEKGQEDPSNLLASSLLLPTHEPVTTLLHLDAGDLFTQLCCNVNVSIPGPKPGIFHGFQGVHNDGVLRVWRHWLAAQAAGPETANASSTFGKGKGAQSIHSDSSILWVSNNHHIGIRFAVKQKKWNRPAPVLVHADEDAPVSYELRFEELLVRTRDLLLASEELADQQFKESGKAIVFGTWI